jgi:predicted metal-dependent enzyme (double-stranded beta helix superfamily)
MTAPTRDHVRIDGADALLGQITAALDGQSPASSVLVQIGDRLARGAATLDLAAARRASISSGRSVVIAHRTGGPALAVRWITPGVPTTIHGHGTWGVAVVAEGHQVCERWEATGVGRARLAEEHELVAGDIMYWGPPPGDVHRQQGARAGALEVIALGGAPSEGPVYEAEGVLERAADALRHYDLAALRALCRADLVLDANTPHWRFQLQGPETVFEAITAGLAGIEEPRVTSSRVTRAASAVAVEVEVHSGQGDQERMWREVHLLRGGDDGIAEDTTYCTGIWDGSAIARQAAEAPMVWR